MKIISLIVVKISLPLKTVFFKILWNNHLEHNFQNKTVQMVFDVKIQVHF